MTAPWPASAVRAAYGPPPIDDAADSPNEGAQRFQGRPFGLDLDDQPRRVAGRFAPHLTTRVPEAPCLPPRPQGPWPAWAPAWLELPLPDAQPGDLWWFPAEDDVPEVWFLPAWEFPRDRFRRDPYAIALVWFGGRYRPDSTRHPLPNHN